MCRKEKAITSGKLKNLPLYLIFQLAAQAKDKLMSGVRHGAWSTVRVALKRKQKRLHPANELLASQPFKDTPRKRHMGSLISFQEDNLFPFSIRTKKRCNRNAKRVRQLIQGTNGW